MVALALSGAALGQGGAGGDEEEQDIIVVATGDGPKTYVGKIKEVNDDGVKFLFEGVDMELPWSALPVTERERLLGKKADGGEGSAIDKAVAGGGKQITATRFYFKNGRVLVGLELEDRSTPTHYVIRKRNAPELHIPRKEVERREPVTLPETEVYTLHEIYYRERAVIDAESGRDNFGLAESMEKIGLWDKAKEHYERAMILDERYTERAKERIAAVQAAQVEGEARKLDNAITRHVRAHRWVDAIRAIRRLAAVDPDSQIRTKWEAQLPRIEEELKKTLRRTVVNSYYNKMTELIRKWVWGRVPVGGEIPGVVVTMKGGTIVQGKLLEDSDQQIVIEDAQGGRIEIAKDMVVDVQHRDLNMRRRDPTLAESRQYVEDTAGGITADILKELEDDYSKMSTASVAVTQEQITEFWKDRLTRVVTIDLTGRRQTVPVSSIHEAKYGIGTWLRDGGAAGAGGGAAVPQLDAGSARRGGGQAGAGASSTGPAGIETDPEKWWKLQRRDARFEILRAFAAEALCEVIKQPIKLACSSCGGKGARTEMTMGASGQVEQGSRICPACRGMGYFVKIRYK